MLRTVLILVAALPLAGCYYAQAAKGQWELTRKREPIAEVLADDDTPAGLAARLRLVQEARRFSIDELGLPDNRTYTAYADIERDYVLWNVFAAPEFSLQPKTWCFPIAGCVSYRGYFSKDAAEKAARRLAGRGFDVAVGGVAAYSTLGKLRDPVLSTMMHWDETRLVGVLFHELAHQVLYVGGDSEFNESFATAVEEFGLQRWLESRGTRDEIETYREARQLRRALVNLVADARDELGEIYGRPIDDDEKRRLKQARFAVLQAAIASRLEAAGRDAGGWLTGELNNARLVSTVLYEGRLPAFRAVLEDCGGDLPCFYDAAKAIAALPPDRRDRRLDELGTP
ncbi:MAG: aminopeptidase [Proteobacteria bacterium]|nr:aminopeptidase [Pseudomonadota bacterium]